MSLADISERQGISLSYLEQLFAKLRRGSLVTSVRGPGGGYQLSRDMASIDVAQVAMLLAPYLRKFGKFTVPDFIGDRFYSRGARLAAVVCLILISVTYVIGQMAGAGIAFSRFLEVSNSAGIWIAAAVVFAYAVFGGMKGITYTQVAQYVVLIIAYTIPAADAAAHRQLGQIVAMLAGQPAHALALGAHHQHARPAQVEIKDLLGRLAGGTDDPQPLLLQLLQRARQVGHRHQRHHFGSAAGDLAHRGVEGRRLVLGHDHRLHSGSIGGAQAGAEIVRIGHPVEHQQQRYRFVARHMPL